jgi:hypothetical protein
MFCIATFIVFGILAIFSASFRPLAKSAWHCVIRRITFRPCDISFGDEMKGKLIGRFIFTRPKLAQFLSRWIDWLSFLFVALSIWSLIYVLNAGLNLWVYDTCNPASAESCSLSGEACGVEQEKLGLIDAVTQNRIGEWAVGPFVRFGETISRIPDRLKTWQPKDYLGPTATFASLKDEAKPYALEVIDPSCKFCKKLTKNLTDAGVLDGANVSYLLYPIPLAGTGGYKFPNSYLMASYVEATKHMPLANATTPGDWLLLKAIFAEPTGTETDIQTKFVMGMASKEQAEQTLQQLLVGIGYSSDQVLQIAALAASQEIQDSLAKQKRIVEEEIRTIKIPTLLFGGRRFDRVVDTDTLTRILSSVSQ